MKKGKGDDQAEALAAAEDIISTTPLRLRLQYADFVEPLYADIWYALVRFGQWDEILARPTPPLEEEEQGVDEAGFGHDRQARGNFVSVATAHWAKAVACASLGRINQATQFCEAFRQTAATVPPERHIHMVPSSRTLAVASKMLDGELAYRRGVLASGVTGEGAEADQGEVEAGKGLESSSSTALLEEAFKLLHEAVALDEALPYDEPWGWMTPAAHALGALLLEQGRSDEARRVFERDLKRWPNNLWSLRGLESCLLLTTKGDGDQDRGSCCGNAGTNGDEESTGLASVRERLQRASIRADIDVNQACFCARGLGTSGDT